MLEGEGEGEGREQLTDFYFTWTVGGRVPAASPDTQINVELYISSA